MKSFIRTLIQDTLTALIENVENAYGEALAIKLLNRLDGIVKKIVKNPYLYQATSIDNRFRRAVISPQSSLVYEVTATKIILLYIFDNRQEPFWIE